MKLANDSESFLSAHPVLGTVTIITGSFIGAHLGTAHQKAIQDKFPEKRLANPECAISALKGAEQNALDLNKTFNSTWPEHDLFSRGDRTQEFCEITLPKIDEQYAALGAKIKELHDEVEFNKQP